MPVVVSVVKVAKLPSNTPGCDETVQIPSVDCTGFPNEVAVTVRVDV